MTQKFSNEFFATLYHHYQTSPYQLFKNYIKNMMPRRGEITNEMIDKLRAYLATKPQANVTKNKQMAGNNKQVISHNSSDTERNVAENDKAFHKLIQESIEQLERQQKIREFASKEAN